MLHLLQGHEKSLKKFIDLVCDFHSYNNCVYFKKTPLIMCQVFILQLMDCIYDDIFKRMTKQ